MPKSSLRDFVSKSALREVVLVTYGSQDPDYNVEMEFAFHSDNDLPKSLESDKKVIEGLAKPPPERDLEYFVSVGLFGEGDNPHRSKEHKHVPIIEIVKVFGKFINRTGYCYKDCCDPVLREKIEKIWMTCYNTDRMLRSKIVST
jgi:hypothetical protein